MSDDKMSIDDVYGLGCTDELLVVLDGDDQVGYHGLRDGLDRSRCILLLRQ